MIRTAIKFGIFVAICLTFTTWLAFTIGNIKTNDPLGRKNFTLHATFDDVTGLLINDNVKISGVVVGKVTGISVDKGRAAVTFKVSNDYKNTLPVDTHAEVRWRNLIGQRYLYLYPGSASTTLQGGATVCADENVCKNKSVIDLGKLFNELGPIVAAIDPAKVNDFLDSVTQALEGREDKVSGVIDDLATLTKALGERDQTIARLVTNLDEVTKAINSRDTQISTMLDNLVVISQAFSDNTATIDAAITELGDFSASLGTILDDNRSQIDRLIANLADVTDVVHGRLDKLDVALKNLDEAAAKIFMSSARGEFLTESILCASIGIAPEDLPPGTCDVLAVKDAGVGASASKRVKVSGDAGLLELLGARR
jgi:phospholipid/cholesterol/gamma-HCH transport system substrate-binding protein